jgi:solute carrier family 25 (mitochondrial adenine nucleotide translocator), member 4/5/6/31
MLESGKAQSEKQYNGAVDCGKKILNQEGIKGFFKGILCNSWRSIGCSLFLV